MDTKLNFKTNTEKDVFIILSEILKADISNLIDTPVTSNGKRQRKSSAQEASAATAAEGSESSSAETRKSQNERKQLLLFLMQAKDAGELNDLHEKFPTLNDINDDYYANLSSSCNKLLKLSFNVIRATKKCIAYLKIYKTYISTNGVTASATIELNSMDYDLELINLIANQDVSDHNNNNSQDDEDEYHSAEEDNDEDTIKEEMRSDEDREYERASRKKRKRAEVKRSLAKKSKPVKVVIGTRIASSKQHKKHKRVMTDSDDSDFDDSEVDDYSSDDDMPAKHSKGRSGGRPKLGFELISQSGKRLVGNSSATTSKSKNGHTVSGGGSKPVPAKRPAKKMFACDQCAFKTPSRNHLKLHVKTHTKKKPKAAVSSKGSNGKNKIIKCKHCNFFATDPIRIREHQRNEHNDESEVIVEQPTPVIPAAKTNDDESIEAPSDALVNQSQNQTFDIKDRQKQCNICPYKTSDAPHLKRHMNNHQFVENFFKCRYCDYYLSKRSAMIQHEIIHSGYKPSVNESWSKKKKQSCLLCPYKANKQAHLKDHVAKHEFKDGYLKCRYCDYYVVNTSALTQHEVIHDEYVQLEGRDKLMHACTKCPFKADKPCFLAEHNVHHTFKVGYQKCRYCDFYAWSNAHMPQHEILHPQYEKPEPRVVIFPCSKCPYQAKTKLYLKQHEENHVSKRDHAKCRYCDFYLSTMSCMKRHEMLHKTEYTPRNGSAANNTVDNANDNESTISDQHSKEAKQEKEVEEAGSEEVLPTTPLCVVESVKTADLANPEESSSEDDFKAESPMTHDNHELAMFTVKPIESSTNILPFSTVTTEDEPP
jgi:KRAB domain-containing zinc finger protein